MALVWWPVLLSRTIGRETLLPLLTLVVLLTLGLGLPVYGRRRSTASQTVAFAGLGTAMAVGIYLHPAGLVTMLTALLFIVYYMAFGRPRLTDYTAPDPRLHRAGSSQSSSQGLKAKSERRLKTSVRKQRQE